jgi:hypothetical protein
MILLDCTIEILPIEFTAQNTNPLTRIIKTQGK